MHSKIYSLTIYLHRLKISLLYSEGHQLPPRRLEPITNPIVAKKRKRAKKKDKSPTTVEDQTVTATDTATATQGSTTLLGESMLSRLRSRLDPLYNTSPAPPPPPSESSSLPLMRLPPLRGPPLPTATEDRGSERANVREDTSVRDGDHTEGSTSQRGSRRRTKRRKKDTQEASQSPGQPSGSQDGGEGVISEQQEELKSTSREALIAGATGGSERKKRRRRERERERSRRTSGRSAGEDTPDPGEEVTAEVTGEAGLDDDGAPPPDNEGIVKHVCVYAFTYLISSSIHA